LHIGFSSLFHSAYFDGAAFNNLDSASLAHNGARRPPVALHALLSSCRTLDLYFPMIAAKCHQKLQFKSIFHCAYNNMSQINQRSKYELLGKLKSSGDNQNLN
jgi:hypothetical protein